MVLTATMVLGLALAAGPPTHAGPIIYAMAGAGNGHLWAVDVGANSSTLIGSLKDPVLGDVGSGWLTDGETPDGTLFFTRRFVNDIHVFSVKANNIHVTAGVIDNLQDRGSTALSNNIDGLTNGPDWNLYLTAYDNTNAGAGPVNGLYRFNPNTGRSSKVTAFSAQQ
jgi:hypothetical protein